MLKSPPLLLHAYLVWYSVLSVGVVITAGYLISI